MVHSWFLVGLAMGLLALAARSTPADDAPFINQWLVCGPFENDAANTGFAADLIDEATVAPAPNGSSEGRVWRYFDDRLFSRNLDDYQDLLSYLELKRGESAAGVVMYAHTYVHCEAAVTAQLRLAADNEVRALVNGEKVLESLEGTPYRDTLRADVELRAGWNRLLLKVANQSAGRLGFYARLCDPEGQRLPGLTYSVGPPDGPLSIATQGMADIESGDMPSAFREWPYVAARAANVITTDWPLYGNVAGMWKPHLELQASPLTLQASGGAPPYRWSLSDGELPPGLRLESDGSLVGTIAADAPLGECAFGVEVTDSAGDHATRAVTITVQDRPNRWYEEARLVALIHAPEAMPEGAHGEFAELMRSQGYGCGMVISFNNGDARCRWPSVFEPDLPDIITPYKDALEAAGIRFGMYMGNLICESNGGDNGGVLLVADAMKRFRPRALWFDWASPTPDGYASIDALYSVVRTIDPDTLIVLNGVGTSYQGDWDVVCLEGWGAWGDRHWHLWPFELPWAKRTCVETWRLVADPEFVYSQGIEPDWREYMRLSIAVIGEGFVANLDHSPTIQQRITSLDESTVLRAHEAMARWANPEGLAPLYEAYTEVNALPLGDAPWGYATVSLDRNTLYLHLLKTPYGKTGFPESGEVVFDPFLADVRGAVCMNQGVPVTLRQEDERLVVSLDGLVEDEVDTIIKLELAAPYPEVSRDAVTREPVPPGNLASFRPAHLLSRDGSHALAASGFSFAHYGVDGVPFTHAQGAFEWAWTYQVDLDGEHPVTRVVIHFADGGYATEYRVHLSADGEEWVTIADIDGAEGGTREHACPPTPARHVRIEAVKPDGPDQPGAQMGIAELEVYE